MKWHYSLLLFIVSQSCLHNTLIPDTYALLLRNSAVGVTSNLWVFRLSLFLFPAGARVLFFLPELSDWVWAHRASCSVAIGGLFPGLKRSDCETQHLPPSYSEPKNSWNYTSIFPYAFPRVRKDSFTFCCCCLCCRYYFNFGSVLKDILRW